MSTEHEYMSYGTRDELVAHLVVAHNRRWEETLHDTHSELREDHGKLHGIEDVYRAAWDW